MKVEKLYEDSLLPVRANPTDSGLDVFVHNVKKYYDIEDVLFEGEVLQFPLYLFPNERVLIGCGIAVSVESGYEIQVRPRSGLALKQGLSIVNTPGTIDSSYRGEVGVILINHSNKCQKISKGDKIAQLVVARVELDDVIEVDEVDETDRGKDGFGSTGK